MNLEEFVIEAGIIIENCGSGWGGRVGYTTKDRPNSCTCGFRTKNAAYKGFLKDTFGENASKAILKLLK